MKEHNLIYFWTLLVGGACNEFRGDLNYHTETPSPPTIYTMDGPTHVLVHVNPDIHKNYAAKVVDYYDKDKLQDFTAFCRCWRSRDFPYCDGFHNHYNKLFGDNAGPLLIRRRNVTNAARYYRRMKRLSIKWENAGTPPLCTATQYPITPSPKPRRPVTFRTINVDAMFKEYGDEIFNFTKHLDKFIHEERMFTPFPETPEPPSTTPKPIMMFPVEEEFFYPEKPDKQI